MKKMFKLAAIAAISSLTIVACNNNKPAEEEADTTAIEQVVEDEMIAEPAEAVEAAPAVEEKTAEPAKATTAKPAAKKEEPKVDETKAEKSAANETKGSLKKEPISGGVKRAPRN
jgi:FKBP-type peptidyl-prolyl cis-trans isomerase